MLKGPIYSQADLKRHTAMQLQGTKGEGNVLEASREGQIQISTREGESVALEF
jgi:hypothetical protein